jgi:hypothetical protein
MSVEEALLILTKVLDKKLSTVQELVFCLSWQGKTYLEIAEISRYETGYIKNVGAQLWKLLSEALGEDVTKNNLHSIIKRCEQRIFLRDHPVNWLTLAADSATPNKVILNARQDWGEAIDTDLFYGRFEELATLEQWVIGDRCRLVTLVGMGGIGKTALSIKLATQVQDQFKYLIWKSLRNAPPIQELVVDLVSFYDPEARSPLTIEGKISQLMGYLHTSRCLLILDNLESVLRSGERAGHYQERYEGYRELLRRIAVEPHQSCLILTSREKLKELDLLQGKKVRSIQLKGLKVTEGQELLTEQGSLFGSENEWKFLIEHYAGNPLALRMISPAIQSFFESNIAQFLEFLVQGTLIFDDIRDLLERQFNRLSDGEKTVMYWLANHRDPLSFLALQKDFATQMPRCELLENLASLERRSLIEKRATGFTQQPIIREYVQEKFSEAVKQVLPIEAWSHDGETAGQLSIFPERGSAFSLRRTPAF